MLRRLTTDDDFINSLLVRGVSIELSRNLPSPALPSLTRWCSGRRRDLLFTAYFFTAADHDC